MLGIVGNCLGPARTIQGMYSVNYLIAILWFVLWVVAIVDCARSSNPNKIVWIIVIILLPILGSLLYFLFGRRTI